MRNLQNVFVSATASIREGVKTITKNAYQICLVVDEDKKLLGTVTDGDIRCGILEEVSFSASIIKIMNSNPITAKREDSREKILGKMAAHKIRHIPVLDEKNRVCDLEILDDILNVEEKETTVVLMAGGLGTRLRPLTNDCPKPMLALGGKPILENILENLIEYGFRQFYFTVNYKAKMVTDHFGDGSRWGVRIHYIHEKQRMGTAGALGFLPVRPNKPLLVMNADLITRVNFDHLLDYHEKYREKQEIKATMCIREYDFQVPYGVVKLDGSCFKGIEEKPVKKFFVNAGIYMIEPEVLNLIPSDTFFDMPQLFEKIIEEEQSVAAFPISEYWLDIGRMDEYTKAMKEFAVD